MFIKADLADGYGLQFYEDDSGNVVISGNVHCDCYSEEVIQVVIKFDSIIDLLGEEFMQKRLSDLIEKKGVS